jgi:hypothetical protein
MRLDPNYQINFISGFGKRSGRLPADLIMQTKDTKGAGAPSGVQATLSSVSLQRAKDV